MSETLLKIQNGIKKFKSKTVLTDINVSISSGEFIALLGPSGSGKTTLLRLLSGLEDWTSGEINQPSNTRSSFVFQEPNLLGWRNVLENTCLPLELSQSLERSQKALSALKSVYLEDSATLFPQELSGGMKMRASIARALVTNPQLLFMDEPFSALDEPTREELQEQVRELWERTGNTVVFVTHSLPEAIFLANRVIFLSAQPTTIIHDYQLTLPATRTAQTRTTDAFFAELNQVRKLFHQDKAKDRNP
jgi:NitT/TauT family transport system ATP-binding protein